MDPTLSYLVALERCRELRDEANREPRSRPPARRLAEAAVQPPSSRRGALRAVLLKISGEPTPMERP